MPLLSGLIGGAAKALTGGLLDGAIGKIKDKVFGRSGGGGGGTNLVAMRNQAIRAGFNPLTVLNATGGQGFATQGGAPPLASSGFISGMQTTFDKLTGKEGQEETRRELENDLLRVQIDEIRRGVNAGPFMPRNPPTDGKTTIRSNGQAPGNPLDIVGNPHTPKLSLGGAIIETNPATSDAEIFEQRYGDIAQEIAGLGIAASDAYHNRATLGGWVGNKVKGTVERIDAAQAEYDSKQWERDNASRAARHMKPRFDGSMSNAQQSQFWR